MSIPLVAVAGGTSQLGHATVKSLLAGGYFTPIVLSRESSKTPQWLVDLNVEVRRVDYLSEKSCEKAMEGVHTLISTLLCKDGTWYQSQVNLLNTGLKQGLKRFVPSEFGLGPKTTQAIDLFAMEQIGVREACQQAATSHADFEWTAFYNGMFTNYLGYGCEREGIVGMDHSLIFDVANMTADIPVPDDGTLPMVTITTIADTARFIAAACTLPLGSWPEESYCAGQTLNFSEIISIVEKVRGKETTVRKHTKTEMQKNIDAIPADTQVEDEFMGRFFLQLTMAFANGEEKASVMPGDLNEKFPEIKTTGVEEYMKEAWGI